MLTVTLTAAGLRYLVSVHVMAVPTMDLLAKLIGLQGEDVDDAFLYEVWLKIWLACAAVLLLTPTLGPGMGGHLAAGYGVLAGAGQRGGLVRHRRGAAGDGCRAAGGGYACSSSTMR